MVTDDTLEEGAPSLGAVEHAGVGDLELAEGQLIGVASLQILSRKRRWQPVEPAPEERVDCCRAKSVADTLQRRRISAPTEAIVERCESNASLLQLALRPTVAIQPQPDRVRRVGIGLP